MSTKWKTVTWIGIGLGLSMVSAGQEQNAIPRVIMSPRRKPPRSGIAQGAEHWRD